MSEQVKINSLGQVCFFCSNTWVEKVWECSCIFCNDWISLGHNVPVRKTAVFLLHNYGTFNYMCRNKYSRGNRREQGGRPPGACGRPSFTPQLTFCYTIMPVGGVLSCQKTWLYAICRTWSVRPVVRNSIK